ncbi:MAG: hypothetical protein ACREO5_01740 [Candidatus Binatia bacterium]
MNFKFMPELEWRYGYFAVIAPCFDLAGFIFLFAQKRLFYPRAIDSLSAPSPDRGVRFIKNSGRYSLPRLPAHWRKVQGYLWFTLLVR